MKKITLLLSFIACVMIAQAQLIVSDNFDYVAGTALTANGWVGTGATPSTLNPILVSAASTITYPSYPGSGVGKEVVFSTTGEDLNKSYAAITSGTIYFSALANITTAGTGDYFLHIGDLPAGSAFFARTFVKLDGSKIAFGIQNVSGGTPTQTYTSSNYDLGTTYLIVVKYVISTNTASLIVNPVISSEPSTGWVSNNSGSTLPPVAGFTTINLRQGSATAGVSATLKLDGIRVATSWNTLFGITSLSNPSANKLDVSLAGKKLIVNNALTSTVEIFSALGTKVQTLELVNGSVMLNSLGKGLYIVRVGKSTAKIML